MSNFGERAHIFYSLFKHSRASNFLRDFTREFRRENHELRAQLGSMTELKMENERLSKLLGFKQSANLELVAARVIGHDLLPDRKTISIDRGTLHGIKKNMATITTGGVVGYIYRT